MITKQVNSKANIKQYSDADYPVNPKQPILARYSAESTAAQTVINLSFSVDTVNAKEAVLIIVDGRVLTEGSSYDYTFTSVDISGYSSQVTLNSSLAASLNIQALKLGFRKESEFSRVVFTIASNVTLINRSINLVNTSAARTLTLPSAVKDLIITVKDSTGSAAANNITVNPTAGLIDGAASATLNTNYQSMTFASDGTNWFKV